MAPSGLAIILGAGPTTGLGIARALSTHGSLAIALLARNPDSLSSLRSTLQKSNPDGIFETFPTDASSPSSLSNTFDAIRRTPSFKDLKLKLAIFNIKHASKKPFLQETHHDFTHSLDTYVGGAMAFSQEVIKLLFEQHGDTLLSQGGTKKGTLVFTGTLGALRTNAQFSAYGASRASVRMLAQGLAKEFSEKGVHVVHTIANGVIKDVGGGEEGDEKAKEEVERGKVMAGESVGKTYLWLSEQTVDLWTHELDLRPAQEKF